MRPYFDRPQFYGLLRVRAERDGRLVPLSYSVGDQRDFDQTTLGSVGREYTIAFCGLPLARTREQACQQLKQELRWFEPLLRGALPDTWFLSEIGGKLDVQ